MNASYSLATSAGAPARSGKPPVPQNFEETGLLPEAINDLILKTLYVKGATTGKHLAEDLRLPFPLLDDLYQDIQQRQLVEVRRATGHGRASYLYDLTGAGRDRAREAMASNQYVGPAPVPLDHYRKWVEIQTIRKVHITVDRIQAGFGHLVLDPEFVEQLGPAINSAKSMFLYGDSGNGKTNMAESIARMLGGDLYVPYAIDVGGQVIVVYDPVYHRPLPDEPEPFQAGSPDWLESAPTHDQRFARVQRPVVFTGGELTLEDLDLQYDTTSKIYQAPFQVKANGGVLIIDDFGRQRVRPRDLLNRWIVPLEKRIDFLTLHTGHKFPVPFDCLLIFATNLNPTELVDEAFLRRIHYKIYVPSPSYDQYVQIFRRCCVARQIPFVAGRVQYIYKQYYERMGMPARSCHPRDIIDHLADTARYLSEKPELTIDLLDRACKSYFLDMPDEGYIADPAEYRYGGRVQKPGAEEFFGVAAAPWPEDGAATEAGPTPAGTETGLTEPGPEADPMQPGPEADPEAARGGA